MITKVGVRSLHFALRNGTTGIDPFKMLVQSRTAIRRSEFSGFRV